MKIIEGLDWKRRVDEVGDNSFRLDLGDRIVTVMPHVGKRHDHFRISFAPSVTAREFSEMASALMNENDAEHEPIAAMLEKPEKVSNFGAEQEQRLRQQQQAREREKILQVLTILRLAGRTRPSDQYKSVGLV
ncbi:DUF6990 domain-containing protein [Ralstonia solanacearum]|uniref:DUF6990 domain-containing protein n=1 Tax=Ralstonia solanacearum TaxID=305 RepID=UPI0012FD257C|nr:hypothetical protein [Ralstonia solanacearum]